MGDNCIRYFHCVEYNFKTGQLCTRICTDRELTRRIGLRKFIIVVTNDHTREAVVRFVKNELLRRGKVGDASLLSVLAGEYTTRIARVYYNIVC